MVVARRFAARPVTAVTEMRGRDRHNRSMTRLTTEATVGQIAADAPAAVRVFETYGIDYCCGGQVGFAEACRKRGLDSERVLAEIETAVATGEGEERDWRTAPVGDLIEHIVSTHHVYLKVNLPRIEEMLQKVMRAHGEAVPPLAQVFGPMKEELDAHLLKEEMILFPMIRTTGRGALGPIRVMMAEHDSAGEALEALRKLTNGYTVPEGACNTWRALYFEMEAMEKDLHRHIHLENNILFPRVG
jgi:regulator of cell morphogenesis and NO signaling